MNDINRYIDETPPDAARPIADLQDIIDWLGTNKPAALAFGSGPKRRIADEIEGLRMNLAAAQAQAAAMRTSLELIRDNWPSYVTRPVHAFYGLESALSPDAGRGWLSPEEAERLTNAIRRIDHTLRIPAAEYVPAIGEVFTIIDGLQLPPTEGTPDDTR